MTLAPVREAADSLVKASTPQPFSTSKTSNWVARVGGLPDYVQHIAHALVTSGHPESEAIQMAIGIVKNPPHNWGAEARAAAAKAAAEWEAKKGASAAKSVAKKVSEAARELQDVALMRIALLEQQFGEDGLIALLAEGMLAEATSSGWAPTMKRTASAANEVSRHEVYDGGQHVGTISCQRGYGPSDSDRHAAFAINGQSVVRSANSRQDAIKALKAHLEEAPARVITLPTANKFLVARPESYSGQTTYTQYSTEQAARHAAGLPAAPTQPELDSKVQAVAEMLTFDLTMVDGLDIVPLRRVQEARRADPFELVEGCVEDQGYSPPCG